MNRAAIASLVLAIALAGCGDSTTLVGPDAEAAFAEAQSTAEESAEIRWVGFAPIEAARPLILVDGERLADVELLQALDPTSIDRIEVQKGCHAQGYWAEAAATGAILIFTKGFEGTLESVLPEYSEERRDACRERRNR